jgi:TonB family protein
MANIHTHYDNLKISRNAPPEVIRAAFKALSQRYHPDKNSSPDATRIMKILNEAYEVLGDVERRRRYDTTLVDEAREEARRASAEHRQGEAHEHPADREPRDTGATASADSAFSEEHVSTASSSTRNKRYGWFWIIGIVFAIVIRLVTSGAKHDVDPQPVSTYPQPSNSSVVNFSSAASAALAGAPVREVPSLITSFDCKKARLASEKLICSDAELASLDLDLATVFAQAKAAASDKRAFVEVARQNWNWRNTNCFDKTCLVAWYSAQRDRLLARNNEPAPPAVVSQPPLVDATLTTGARNNVADRLTQPVSNASPSALYPERVIRRVRPSIVWTGDTAGLETVIAVRCTTNGTLLSAAVLRSSGNAQWDEAALRAVQRSDPMPLDMNGEVPVSFTITLRPSAEGSSSLRTGGDQVGNQSAVPETSSLVSGQQAQSPSQKADRAIYWAHALAQQHADADAAYDLAKQNLGAINASCPDAILLQQTPKKAGPYKPVILFLSRQCGYIVSYWPESGEEQISFDRSMIESWSGYCSTRVGPRTTCLKGNGA